MIIYYIRGSDAGSLGLMNIIRRAAKAVRKHEPNDRNGVNLRCWRPMKSVREALGSRRFRRFLRSSAYKMMGAERGNGRRSWQDAEQIALNRPIAQKGAISPPIESLMEVGGMDKERARGWERLPQSTSRLSMSSVFEKNA